MIEAYKFEHRPLAYALLRRLELSQWSFRTKHWHPRRKWYARLRSLVLVWLGHETEICGVCGGKVGVVWWCPSAELWTTATGWINTGVTCIRCFDDLAKQNRIPLRWVSNLL